MSRRISMGMIITLGYCALMSRLGQALNPPALDEEFNGAALDTTTWVAMNRHGDYGNNEAQCYTPANVSMANGALTITSKIQSMSCGDAFHAAQQWNYTSAMVQWKSY